MRKEIIQLGKLRYYVLDDHALVMPILKDDKKKIEHIEIPSSIKYNKQIIPVTVIGASAFRECKALKTVVLPDSIEEIRHNAFTNCFSLERIIIPPKVREIKYGTFYNCINLRSAILHDNICNIEMSAFYNCKSLESITIPDNIQLIHRDAFYSCTGLKNVVLHVSHFMRYDKANLFSQIVKAGLIADNPMFHGS